MKQTRRTTLLGTSRTMSSHLGRHLRLLDRYLLENRPVRRTINGTTTAPGTRKMSTTIMTTKVPVLPHRRQIDHHLPSPCPV
ncbi:unnamed protein product [Acanthoscelides obtectus]|uniref:Uncharacterized protein n=1 Tax=Acanthoscelides obtectus TaxID=200917 RepID=A0A9P0JS75_ACAOB|nr:unnamed protein product [Acanthoscelides obtectus]CAK1661753.1 hypothetical protein AOBTE_LOCUS22775 [Acanthoscelides obtectus]